MFLKQISKNIKKLREELKLSQAELAEKLNVSSEMVNAWEIGNEYPAVSVLPKLGEIFDISVDDLYDEKISTYKNKFERLVKKYESDISQISVFLKAVKEFNDLQEANQLDAIDLANFGKLNYLMSKYYLKSSEKAYYDCLDKLDEQDSFYCEIKEALVKVTNKLNK
ncbi:MAG: helix-turn-helix transcriptional regulator [Bacilli bacterium]|nr:helix-turn-helix transcriptional regulator [Bacilli bacterium]